MKEFLLGVVQGLTEFLPVSSSGHLGLFSRLMNLPSDLALFAFLHLATFLVVLIFLWNDVWSIFLGLIRLQKDSWQLAFKIIVSSVPAGVIGLLFEKKVNEALSSQKLIGLFFIITAVTLWYSDKFSGKKTMETLSYIDALTIGLFQAVAILPGVSRSGLTLVGALIVGMARTDAFKYSFLMSLPITLVAGLFEMRHITFTPLIFSGFAGAFFSGLIALVIVKMLTISAHLKYFSIYLIIPILLSFFL
ncbi:MAG: undecaprenyl-diphosphate phosphatase [Fervidobacterium sp.]